MKGKVVKIFNIEGKETEDGQYKLTVKSNGRVIKSIINETEEAAFRTLRNEKFQRIAIIDGPRILVQDDRVY